eukprot:17254_6
MGRGCEARNEESRSMGKDTSRGGGARRALAGTAWKVHYADARAGMVEEGHASERGRWAVRGSPSISHTTACSRRASAWAALAPATSAGLKLLATSVGLKLLVYHRMLTRERVGCSSNPSTFKPTLNPNSYTRNPKPTRHRMLTLS